MEKAARMLLIGVEGVIGATGRSGVGVNSLRPDKGIEKW